MSKLINKLRMLGFYVSIYHKRIYKNRWVVVNCDTKKLRRIPLPKGGKTIVTISSDGGLSFVGEAVCLKTDSYKKKRGLEIALGRALKKMANTFEEINLE